MLNVTIIDDDKNFSDYLKSELENIFHITVYSRVEEAFKKIKKIHSDCFLIDMINQSKNDVSTCNELLKKIRRNSDTPVLMMTSDAITQTALESQKIGANEFIEKANTTISEMVEIIFGLIYEKNVSILPPDNSFMAVRSEKESVLKLAQKNNYNLSKMSGVIEKYVLPEVLKKCPGNLSKAARILFAKDSFDDTDYRTRLKNLLKRHDIEI